MIYFLTSYLTVTVEAANAIKKYNVGIKCATITPDEKRVKGNSIHRTFCNLYIIFLVYLIRSTPLRVWFEEDVEVA